MRGEVEGKTRLRNWAVVALAFLLALLCLSCETGGGSGAEGGGEGVGESFTFLVCGDVNGVSPQLRSVVKEAGEADFLAIVGDLTPSGSEAEYRELRDFLQASGIEYHVVRGDNDRARDPSGAVFTRYFGPLWHSFDHKGCHFLLADSSDGYNGYPREELEWMESDLAAASGDLKAVFTHIPPGAPPDLSAPYESWERARESEERALEIWREKGVDTVFCGHLHAYMVYREANPRVLVTGGGGSPLHLPEAMGGYYHYLRVRVEGGSMQVEVVRL